MAPPGSALVASWYVDLVIAAPFIATRLRSRWKRPESLGVDDIFFIASIFLVLGFNATVAQMWNQGLSDWKAGYMTSDDDIVAILEMVLPSKILYVSATFVIKFSVVLFYRIVAQPESRIVIVSYVVLAYLFASWGGILAFTFYGCRPYDKYWSQNPAYQCSEEFNLISWWLLTALNISTNVIVVCLPVTMVMKLDMRLRDKFAIGFMFVLGSVVVAASSMQAYYNKKNNIMLAATVSMVELSAGLIAASLLALGKAILGKYAFQASAAPERHHHGFDTSHHQAHMNELKLLEAYKTEKNANASRSLSVLGTNSNNGDGMSSTLNSHNRVSAASKDSLVLPGQYHIGLKMDGGTYDHQPHPDYNIEKITICADFDDFCQEGRSSTRSMKVRSPATESWYAS